MAHQHIVTLLEFKELTHCHDFPSGCAGSPKVVMFCTILAIEFSNCAPKKPTQWPEIFFITTV